MASEVQQQTKGEVFRARLTSTLILWAVVTSVFWSQNVWAFFALIGFLALAGALEFRGLFSKYPGAECRLTGLLLGSVTALLGGVFLITGVIRHDDFRLELLGLVLMVVVGFYQRFRFGIQGRESVDALGDGLLAYVYVPVLFGSFVFRLMFLPETEAEVPGAWLILLMIAAAKFTDMGAYLTGSLIGKNKMAPHLSPAKTWEGFFGALGFAQLAAWGVWDLSGEILGWIPAFHVGVLAFLIGLAAVAGDLAESVLKRSLEVKDSGKLMPGIGGVLDLIDSLCFAAPVVYFYVLAVGLVS